MCNTKTKLVFNAVYHGYHKWKVVQLNVQISQGSVATDVRCGGSVSFCLFRSLSLDAQVKELLKSDHICQSYHKNRSGNLFYLGYGVYTRRMIIYIFIRLDGQQTAHNTQLENTIKHNHTQLKER